MTEKNLFLLKENFSSWPTLNQLAPKPQHPQFTLKHHRPLQDVYSLTLSKRRNYLKIQFTGEEGDASDWEIYTQNFE
jgi:hypothetical protein